MAAKSKVRNLGTAYKGPYGTPLAHVHYCQGRHLDPQRIPFHRHEKPVSIRLLDVSKESLENIRKVAASLRRLLAPSLKLKTIPDSLVAYLEHLERLDLGHNRLTDGSFPDAMRSLELLVELRLNDNQLTRVPSCLRRMRNLTRLDLSDNQLESVTGLERLKKLQFLVLDNNSLSTVFRELSSLRKLEMLRCSSNSLRDVPRDIRNLRHLKDLDVSNNRILLLPTDVFLLPRLESLNASQNQVGKIPSFNVKVQNKHWISSLDLSDNSLVKFPGHLMNLTHKLDLSANKIRTLTWAALKKVDYRDQELLLDSNPLVFPPTDICESGLKTIMQFLQESQADVKTYQGVKVLVVGSQGSGKSSLVYSLVDQQARLSDDMTDTAVGIDAYDMSFDYDSEDGKPGTSLNLCLWDFCGDPFYLYPHYLFHEQPSITVLTFNMATYSSHNFTQQVGSWFDWMIAKTNKLVVILVGTKADLVSKKRAGQITKEVREKLAIHLQKRQTLIEQRIKEIETRPVISPTLSEQLKVYMKLLQAKFTVQTEVTVTSSKAFTGFDKLKEAIETLSGDRKLFPNVMRVIPTFWVEVENWLEERGNSLLVPVMPWEEYSEEVTQRFGMKHLLDSITHYLHDTGKVLWFSTVPSLKQLVFLRPAWLFDVLKNIFRHDMDTAAFTPDDTLKVIAFTPSKFERLKQEFLADGIVDRELLKGLLVSLIPADVNKPFSEVLQILTERLEMGYPVSRTSRDLTFDSSKEQDAEGNVYIHRLLLPWFRRCAESTSVQEQWLPLADRRHLAVLFRFPFYLPPGLFELITVRAHQEKHNLVFLSHWGGGIHARHNKEKVQLLVTYYNEGTLRREEEWVGEEEGEGTTVNKGDGHFHDNDRQVTSEGNQPMKGKEEQADSEAHGTVRTAYNRQRSARRPPDQDMDMPETILEMDEEEEEEEEDEEEEEEEQMSGADDSCSDPNRKRPSDDVDGSEVSVKDRKVGGGAHSGGGGRQRQSAEVSQARDEAKARLRALSRQRRQSYERDSSGDGGSVVIKFELRDHSEDQQDQTPAASMWNVLLPLLMDFEDLLQRYAGVLVERRTQCPLCGEASFLGEWLTPKETQGLNTRQCDLCGQHVDTAFLVQPREKKRDDVMRTLIRRTTRRRGAAVTSDIEDIHRVAPPNPRRAALVALDREDENQLQQLAERLEGLGSLRV